MFLTQKTLLLSYVHIYLYIVKLILYIILEIIYLLYLGGEKWGINQEDQNYFL